MFLSEHHEGPSPRRLRLSREELLRLDEIWMDRQMDYLDLLLVGTGGTGKSQVRQIMVLEHNIDTSTAPITFYKEHRKPCDIDLALAIQRGSPVVIALTCCGKELAKRRNGDGRKDANARKGDGLRTSDECELAKSYLKNVGLAQECIVDTNGRSIREIADEVLSIYIKIRKEPHLMARPLNGNGNGGASGPSRPNGNGNGFKKPPERHHDD